VTSGTREQMANENPEKGIVEGEKRAEKSELVKEG